MHLLISQTVVSCDANVHVCQMSLVDLGKRLLEAARKGQDDEVRNLMANGAPFTTDWVSLSDTNKRTFGEENHPVVGGIINWMIVLHIKSQLNQ